MFDLEAPWGVIPRYNYELKHFRRRIYQYYDNLNFVRLGL